MNLVKAIAIAFYAMLVGVIISEVFFDKRTADLRLEFSALINEGDVVLQFPISRGSEICFSFAYGNEEKGLPIPPEGAFYVVLRQPDTPEARILVDETSIVQTATGAMQNQYNRGFFFRNDRLNCQDLSNGGYVRFVATRVRPIRDGIAFSLTVVVD